jgi:hypothetical protein
MIYWFNVVMSVLCIVGTVAVLMLLVVLATGEKPLTEKEKREIYERKMKNEKV